MNRLDQRDCCKDLFTEFEFQDLRSASPPNKKGVYVIRIKKEGSSVIEIIEQIKQCIKKERGVRSSHLTYKNNMLY